jgi:hypothetical protein
MHSQPARLLLLLTAAGIATAKLLSRTTLRVAISVLRSTLLMTAGSLKECYRHTSLASADRYGAVISTGTQQAFTQIE